MRPAVAVARPPADRRTGAGGRARLRLPARALLLVLAGTLGTSPVAGCGSDDTPRESTLGRIRRTGVARLAYANEAPYGYRDVRSGRVTGEAPEIARVVLRALGARRISTSLVSFGQLIPGLQAGRYDMIAAGMYITPERCRRIDFSNPTYAVGEAFLVRRGNPADLHGFGDAAAAEGVRLGVVGGTVEFEYAERIGMPDDRLVVFPDNATGLAGLRNRRIDAFAVTALTARHLLAVADVDDVELAEPFEQPALREGRTRSFGAFGFREEDDALRGAVDAQLAGFIGTPDHLELVAPFGFTRNELPGDVTAEDLCDPGDL